MFGVKIHLHYQFCNIWLNLGRQYCPQHVRIHPPTSINNNIINQHQWSSSIISHKCQCHNTASTMSNRWYGILRVMSYSSPFHVFLLLSFLSFNPDLELGSLPQMFSGKVRSGLPVLQCYQWFAPCRTTLSNFSSFFRPNDDFLHLQCCRFGLYAYSSKNHLQDANLTFEINTGPFFKKKIEEIKKK